MQSHAPKITQVTRKLGGGTLINTFLRYHRKSAVRM